METHAAFRMYFERKRKSSPGFSMRSLALRLKVSPSFLSRTLSGKKPIPADLQVKLAQALDIEPELLSDPRQSQRRSVSTVNPAIEDWAIADSEAIQILRNWYYIPILELTTLENFDGTAQAVSHRLNLSLPSAEVALRELVSLGLLKLEEGRYRKTDSKLRFTSAKSVHLIRKFHDDMMEKSQQELRTGLSDEEFHRRLIAGITVTCSPEAVQAAKRKLSACLHEIANDLTAAPGTEVYHLASQLFPLTRP
jgi:uncharacterized protein (TIGR02147 family)